MEDNQKYVVSGFIFNSEGDAGLAKEELQKIKYLEKHIDYKRPENVLAIYNKMLENNIAQTPVSWDYLRKMQIQMIEDGLSPGEIPSIPLNGIFNRQAYYENGSGTPATKQRIKPSTAAVKTPEEKYRLRFKQTLTLSLFMACLVAAMFYILLTGKNANIINYEKNLINQYSSWEQELMQREQAVREKEALLKSH